MVDFDKHAQERYSAFEATGGPAHGGVTVLDWFAGKALTGILHDAEVFWEGAATLAYQYAEAMLKERAKRHAPEGAVVGVTGKTYG